MLVGNRTHHASYGQTVKVIVDENQHAQGHGSQLRAGTGLDVLSGPASEGSRASGPVHQRHDGAQDNQEHQNAHIIAVRQNMNDSVLKDVNHRSLETEIGVEQASHQDTQEQ